MNAHNKVILPLILCLTVSFAIAFWNVSEPILAQAGCCTPPAFGPVVPKFPLNSNVTVTISGAFTANERNDIIAALINWNSENGTNGSGIYYLSFLTGETPILQANNQFVGYDPNTNVAGINHVGSSGSSVYSRIYLGPSIRSPMSETNRSLYVRGLMRHEIGHSEHLDDSYTCPNGSTVMYYQGSASSLITSCDNEVICNEYGTCPAPTPTPTPPCPEPPNTYPCNIEVLDTSCPFYQDMSWCQTSPILVDTNGDGFNLTNAAQGVQFDLANAGSVQQTAWTTSNTDDAWLVLDRNGNGSIDNGKEMFGNATLQPSPPFGEERNGFLALAEFDKVQNGGNDDGFITRRDVVFSSLRLWRDANHNGLSEPSELFTLPQLGLRKLHLDYQESDRVDQHGNAFKYRAKVKDAQDAQLGRWAWDVFLVRE